MFNHSVRVPRLYKIAAKVAKDVTEGVGSLKQLVYEYRSKHPNIKAIYALVATLFQRSVEVDNLLKRSQLLAKEPRSDPLLTKILMVELLWGKKTLPGNSKPEKTVLAYEQIFKAHISDIPVASKENNPDNKEDLKPRYVRVNTLSMSLNEAIDGFREEGWVLSKFLDKKDYSGFLDKISTLTNEEFLVDIHIPDLLIFPPKTQFYNHPAYKNGCIILQDKASCLPVHILSPPPGCVALDMCAAPGMKTTQLAAAMKNEGKIYAVERHPRRFEILSRIVEASGATCITTINKDVLTCNEKDFPGVEYILVDPSCSGSGITGRMEFEQSKSNQRIEKLAGFQIKILRSALTRYPNAKRVVYSTCSVFPEENEDVVRQVLETNSKFKLVPATNFVNDTWKNFGSPEYGNIGSYCLYAKPNEDFTNGFFVAVFERLEEGEENPFFNTKIYNFKKHVQSQEIRKRRQQEKHQQLACENSKDNKYEQDFTEDGKYNVEANDSKYIEGTERHNSAKKKKKKKKEATKIDIPSNEFQNNEHTVENDNKEIQPDTMLFEDAVTQRNSVKKKKKKRDNSNIENVPSSEFEANDAIINKEKKKKKKDYNSVEQNTEIDKDSTQAKEEKSEIELVSVKEEFADCDKKKKKKKKDKKRVAETDVFDAECKKDNILHEENVDNVIKTKQTIKRELDINDTEQYQEFGKKRKKKKNVAENDFVEISVDTNTERIIKKEDMLHDDDIGDVSKIKRSIKRELRDNNDEECETKDGNKKIKKKKKREET